MTSIREIAQRQEGSSSSEGSIPKPKPDIKNPEKVKEDSKTVLMFAHYLL